MTINEAVSTLQIELNANEVTALFTPAYLWRIFSGALATVRRDELRSYRFINPTYYHTFCIEMVQGTTHDCSCVTQGCPALVSKHPIPRYLSNTLKNSLTVKTLGGKSLTETESEEFLDCFLLDEGYKNQKVYFIENGKLIFPNQTNPKILKVRAIWENIADWDNIQFCDDTTTTTNCDIDNVDIGMPDELLERVLRKSVRMIMLAQGMKEDNLPDNNEQIR